MSSISLREKKVKDLTITEFKHLVEKSIAEDIEAWKDTFEIMADKNLMKQIKNAENARMEEKNNDFIPWGKLKKNV